MSAATTTVGDLVRVGARRSPDRVAVRMRGGAAVSYAELDRRTDRLANGLLGNGLQAGDRIAAWMEDRIEYIELYLAAAKTGLVVVPINARFLASEAIHQLTDSGAAALVWTGGLSERIAGLGDALAELLLVSVDADDARSAHRYEDLVAGGAESAPVPPQPDDLFIIGYTSGTTGAPKGAMLTHRNVLALARMNAVSYHLGPYGVAALTGSMSFVATVPAHIFTHFYVGGTVVIMGSWDVESLLATIASERVTFTYVPSPLIADFTACAAADRASWASLGTILHSASRGKPDELRALCEVVGDRFVEGLGMTENSGGLVTATTREDATGESAALDVFASAGRATVETLVEIVGEDGSPLPHDGTSIGEIVARSPAMTAGYWNLPEATAAAFSDGWYRSGDLGAIDPAGYLYVSDRRTDLIVSGGMNVYPSEVEHCLMGISGVAEVAVVGVPHERWGRTVVAAVVRAPGARLTASDVIAHAAARLAGYKKPTAVVFFESLPRTASLKVRRGSVRELVIERLASPESEQISTKRLSDKVGR